MCHGRDRHENTRTRVYIKCTSCTDIECFTCVYVSMCVSVSVRHVRIAVESVLMWEQPVTSGLALASVTAAFFLLEKSGFTLIALTANILLVAVLGVFVWSNVATVLNLYVLPKQTNKQTKKNTRSISLYFLCFIVFVLVWFS